MAFVVAAGNEGKDACSYSPGRQSWLITVGATDVDDVMGRYSNYGPCVDILAPGSGTTLYHTIQLIEDTKFFNNCMFTHKLTSII